MQSFLLPYKFKRFGALLVLLGLGGLICFLWFDFRIMLPVFAVFSSFLDTKFFTFFRTNVADEMIMLFFLAGFFFMVVSKEKTESENQDKMRVRAFWKAILVNTGLLVFSVLFIYGNGFLTILLLNLYSFFIFYLIFYFFLKRKN